MYDDICWSRFFRHVGGWIMDLCNLWPEPVQVAFGGANVRAPKHHFKCRWTCFCMSNDHHGKLIFTVHKFIHRRIVHVTKFTDPLPSICSSVQPQLNFYFQVPRRTALSPQPATHRRMSMVLLRASCLAFAGCTHSLCSIPHIMRYITRYREVRTCVPSKTAQR